MYNKNEIHVIPKRNNKDMKIIMSLISFPDLSLVFILKELVRLFSVKICLKEININDMFINMTTNTGPKVMKNYI
jgi:hypothetical protein